MSKSEVEDISEKLCAGLASIGFTFYWDQAGGQYYSRYIQTQKPIKIKIRVSDHPSDMSKKRMAHSRAPYFDVGPHGMSCEDVLSAISALKQ